MTARVKALGYAVVGSTDPAAWQEFGSGLLGLQVAHSSEDRLTLRMDQFVHRFDIRRAATDGVIAIGWDVGNPAALGEITARLTSAGYEVTTRDAEAATERSVSGLASFRDPDDNYDIELFWGLRNAAERFVSPTGATFVAGDLGVGHAFQVVRDEQVYTELYLDLLGFRLSDHIDMPGGVSGVFTHCNPRHHSFAFAASPNRPIGVGHFMFEVDDLDIVGRSYDHVLAGAAPILSTFGKHTNDKMVSYYVRSPSGFGIEYGTDGILIDDESWLPTRYDVAHYWGHHRTP
ncbi:VOC family protein [Knoellia sp. S7-12]|uniref:VOC family protein n=1 Tax=Knoellia sp. S7-12 TaxID=3126698 RepID=UPI003366FB3E